jgi:hypothetical protein
MKLKIFLCLLPVLAILLISCGNKPEKVVEKYLTHLYKDEFIDANKYVLKEKQGFCILCDNHVPEEIKLLWSKSDVSVNEITCKIIDDTTAVCTCNVTRTLNNKEEHFKEKIMLKKVKLKWYVNKGKEDYQAEDIMESVVAPSPSEDDIINSENTDTTCAPKNE